MSIEQTSQNPSTRKSIYTIRKLLVAHDFSESTARALVDAKALANRFDADLVIAHVERHEATGTRIHSPVRSDLKTLAEGLCEEGYRCRGVLLRSGDEAKAIADLLDDEKPDLLMLGAYGHGSQDRTTLGSTTERLLRSAPCPVLTYGPKSVKTLAQWRKDMSILLPFELPSLPRYLEFAVAVAKLFRARLELLHVVDMGHSLSLPHAYQDAQFTCEEIARHLGNGDMQVSASLLFGTPAEAITLRSQELNSALILIPLDTRPYLSSKDSDNVAANVIRHARVPVMTYRFDL